jgi:hypothetical protein
MGGLMFRDALLRNAPQHEAERVPLPGFCNRYIQTTLAPMSDELQALAEILADWIKPARGIPAVYLFGSRVRGDHRHDSDVDVRLFLDEWSACDVTVQWWLAQNESDFAELKSQLPGPLEIHREDRDDADKHIHEGRKNPVLVLRRVVCVWTPPKAAQSAVNE